MPALKNPKHELFAVGISKGKSATQAYKDAGYSPARQNASALMSKYDIASRIAELQTTTAKRTEWTLERLVARVAKIAENAEAANQYGPAVSAMKELGILTGLRVEKSERKNVNAVAELDEAELDERIAQLAAREKEATGSPPITH